MEEKSTLLKSSNNEGSAPRGKLPKEGEKLPCEIAKTRRKYTLKKIIQGLKFWSLREFSKQEKKAC